MLNFKIGRPDSTLSTFIHPGGRKPPTQTSLEGSSRVPVPQMSAESWKYVDQS